MSDDFDLDRFITAQDGAYEAALAEIRHGRKTSHWMWFVFPQIAGLGRSEMSRRYAISSLSEAQSYLRHPVLGPHLLTVTRAVAESDAADAASIFGSIDAVKLRSSMTLFARAAPGEPAFTEVLRRYFDGFEDPETLARL